MQKKFLLIMLAVAACSSLVYAGDKNQGNHSFRLPANVTPADYKPNTIIVKVKPEFRSDCNQRAIYNDKLNAVFTSIGAGDVKKLFPSYVPPAVERNAAGLKMVDLTLVYEVHYQSNLSIEKAVNAILNTGMVIYAEPKYIQHVSYVPNDYSSTQQYFINKIQAPAAWDIQQGDTSVVIGIVDSGTDWNHPDLQSNIKYNYADPINGLDDDGDGYIDNYRGWDVSENDNDPMVTPNLDHGSHVSGCADAVTDNGTGVASPGFKCKFLPVKSSLDVSTSTIDNGYEGITYAADHGCSIINCSWGGPGGGQFGQDAVDYATINHNALVVCAAGNGGVEESQYPSSFNYAFSVAATTSSDNKSGFSSYGVDVDVCAPGSNIYSTVYNNSYISYSGTSMASPITAGAAAIVKSQFPTYTALQVGEQLRMTADNIYGVGINSTYQDKLGTGRINMFRAVTESPKSARVINMQETDNNDNAFVVGDTVRITGDIINYLAALSNLSITMTTTSPYVTILDGTTNPGAMATLATTNNNADPFTVKINPSAPQNSLIRFKFTLSDGTYSAVQFLDVTVNVDYINVTINDVATSITSKGAIGFNDNLQTQGLGFQYLSNNMIYDATLMIGNNNNVSDMARDGANWNTDFVSSSVVQRVIPSVASDFDLFGKFNDNGAGTTKLNVLVTHKAYAWSSPGNRKFVIVEYSIKNNGANSLNSLYAGIFADWDVMNYANNKANEVPASKMGYAYSTDVGGIYGGVKLLTGGPWKHYAIDNIAGGAGGIDITAGYTSAQKYTTLSTNRAAAGGAGTGNDVCDVVSTGPFTVATGDSVIVAFALIAGDDVNDITTSAANAQTLYDGITGIQNIISENGFEFYHPYPNPSDQNCGIDFYLPSSADVKLEVYNSIGQRVTELENAKLNKGNHHYVLNTSAMESGIYFCTLKAADHVLTYKLNVVH